MDILKFRVRGQALTLINPNIKLIPVTDTVNQYLCQFEFSEDWNDLNKVVVFKNVSYNITKEVYLSTSNECYIPWEVLSNSGDIFLEVIGTEVRGEVVTVRIPSTLLGFKWEIQEGLLDVSANISPTPDLFEQFVSSVRSDSIVAATARDEAVIARDVAVQSASDASASELAATSAAESAVNSASTASSAASSASESALSVAGVADETKSYAEIASAKAADASTQAEIAAGAKEDAVIAKGGAEAARDEAATSADLAQTTESHIKTMTVSAHSLAETEAPTVTKTDTSTGFALDFGIPKGATGPKGEDGDNIHYTWVKYADTPTSGMSDNPTGKDYIGIAYNKSTPVGSTVYSDYAWSRIKGEAGEDGYSPTVTTGTASDGSTTVTVTNKDGSNTVTLADGKARADIANLEIGGRNLLVSSYPHISGNTKDGYTNRGWASSFMLNDNLVKMLEPSTEYTIRYKYRVDSVKEGTTAQTMNAHGVFLLYSANGYPYTWLFDTSIDTMAEANSWNVGDIVERKTTFTTPANLHDADAAYEILYYTSRRMKGTTYVLNDEGTFFDIKIEKGNKATDWTPAPEDVDAAISRSFGLVGGISIPSSSDLNDYKTVGNYYSAGSGVSSTLSNTPITDSAFMLKVLNGYTTTDTGSILLQKIVNSYDSTEYVRSYSGGTWKPWRVTETRSRLWTNASIKSSFAAQTIPNLDASIYDAIEVVAVATTTDTNQQIIRILKGNNGRVVIIWNSRNVRDIKFSSDGTVYVYGGNASSGMSGSLTSNDSVAIPYIIYGIKGV